MPKERVRAPRQRTHNALSEDLHADKYVVAGQTQKGNISGKRIKRNKNTTGDDQDRGADLNDHDVEAGMIPHKMAKRILQQSRQHQEQFSSSTEGGGKRRVGSSASAAAAAGSSEEKVGQDGDDDAFEQDASDYKDEQDWIDDGDENYFDDEAEWEDDNDNDDADAVKSSSKQKSQFKKPLQQGDNDNDGEEDDELVELEYDDTESQAPSEMQEFSDLAGDYELDDEEARLLGKFQPAAPTQSRNLADIIMEKIREKEMAVAQQSAASASGAGGGEGGAGGDDGTGKRIDGRVRRVYAAIGRVLKSYTSGKVPKAFKILPRVQNWEQLILLTKPEDWSPHATYAATRIFAAALNERMAQRFYNAVLLPICHTYIQEQHHLHPAMYMALRKALFKPIAFYKGFLLPLCAEDGTCTLKEALIVGSVLQKMHLQPIPTAVVIVKLCEMPFSSPNVLFLRVLIDKKMSLPFQAIDALVAFFHRFSRAHSREEKLPVLWHQALLSFTQRYRGELKTEQIGLLHEVCNKHFHQFITPEVRRELAAAVGAISSMH